MFYEAKVAGMLFARDSLVVLNFEYQSRVILPALGSLESKNFILLHFYSSRFGLAWPQSRKGLHFTGVEMRE
jgi:hypothetical protein